MAIDTLDPGPNGDYPYIERRPDGTLNTDSHPVGYRLQPGPDGKPVLIDVTQTLPDGRRITDVVPLSADDAAKAARKPVSLTLPGVLRGRR